MEKLKKRPRQPQPTERKRKVSRYWIFLLALVVVNVIIIAVVLSWLGRTLEDYEKHTPSHALDQYFTQLAAGDTDGLIPAAEAAGVFAPDANSSWADYFSILRQRFNVPAEQMTFRRTSAKDLAQGEELYTIYDGETRLGQVHLRPDDKAETGWAAYATVDQLTGYTVTAPDIVTVFMNGAPLPESSITGTTPLEIFELMHDQSGLPATVQYTETTPTLTEPTFTAEAATGGPCEVVVDREARTVTVSVPPTAEQEAEFATVLETTAKAYSDFITEDMTFSGLRPYLYTESQLYQNLAEYQWGWYLTHENREFLDVVITDLVPRADNLFTGHIEFTVNVYRGTQIHVEKPSYDMAFIRDGEQWLLAGIKVYHRD